MGAPGDPGQTSLFEAERNRIETERARERTGVDAPVFGPQEIDVNDPYRIVFTPEGTSREFLDAAPVGPRPDGWTPEQERFQRYLFSSPNQVALSTYQTLEDAIAEMLPNLQARLTDPEQHLQALDDYGSLTFRYLAELGAVPANMPKGTSIFDDDFRGAIMNAPYEIQRQFAYWQDPSDPELQPFRIAGSDEGAVEIPDGSPVHRSFFGKMKDMAGDGLGSVLKIVSWPSEQVEMHLGELMIQNVSNAEVKRQLANHAYQVGYSGLFDRQHMRDIIYATNMELGYKQATEKYVQAGVEEPKYLEAALNEGGNFLTTAFEMGAYFFLDPLWAVGPAKGAIAVAKYGSTMSKVGFVVHGAQSVRTATKAEQAAVAAGRVIKTGQTGRALKASAPGVPITDRISILPRFGRFLAGGEAAATAKQLERMVDEDEYARAVDQISHRPGFTNWLFHRRPEGLAVETMRVTTQSLLQPWIADGTKTVDDLAAAFGIIQKGGTRANVSKALIAAGWSDLAANPDTARLAEYMKVTKTPWLKPNELEKITAMREAGLPEGLVKRVVAAHTIGFHQERLEAHLLKQAPTAYNKVIKPFIGAQKMVLSVMSLGKPAFIALNAVYDGFIGLVTSPGRFPFEAYRSAFEETVKTPGVRGKFRTVGRGFSTLAQRNIRRLGGDPAQHEGFISDTTLLRDILGKEAEASTMTLSDAEKLVDDIWGLPGAKDAGWGEKLRHTVAWPVYISTRMIDNPTRKAVYSIALADQLHFADDWAARGGMLPDLDPEILHLMPDWMQDEIIASAHLADFTPDGARAIVNEFKRRLASEFPLERYNTHTLVKRFVRGVRGMEDPKGAKVLERDFAEPARLIDEIIAENPDADIRTVLEKIDELRDSFYTRANIAHEMSGIQPLVSEGHSLEKARVFNLGAIKQQAMDTLGHIERTIRSVSGAPLAAADNGRLMRMFGDYYQFNIGNSDRIWRDLMSYQLDPKEAERITKGARKAAMERIGKGVPASPGVVQMSVSDAATGKAFTATLFRAEGRGNVLQKGKGKYLTSSEEYAHLFLDEGKKVYQYDVSFSNPLVLEHGITEDFLNVIRRVNPDEGKRLSQAFMDGGRAAQKASLEIEQEALYSAARELGHDGIIIQKVSDYDEVVDLLGASKRHVEPKAGRVVTSIEELTEDERKLSDGFVRRALWKRGQNDRKKIMAQLDNHYRDSLNKLTALETRVIDFMSDRDLVYGQLMREFFAQERQVRTRHVDMIGTALKNAQEAGSRSEYAAAWTDFGERVGRMYEDLADARGRLFGWGPVEPQYNVATDTLRGTTALAAFRATQVDEFLTYAKQHMREDYPLLFGRKTTALPKAVDDALNTWADDVARTRTDQGIAIQIGAFERAGFALTNYERQYGLDAVLQVIAPFEFFPSRILWNWSRRMWDNPGATGAMFKMGNMFDTVNERQQRDAAEEAMLAYGATPKDAKYAANSMGLPSKYRHQVPIPIPHLSGIVSAFGGDMDSMVDTGWFDPLALLNPYELYNREYYEDEEKRSTPLGMMADWTSQNTPFGPSPLWTTAGAVTGALPDQQAWINTVFSGGPFGLPSTRAARGILSFMATGEDMGELSDEDKEFLVNNDYLPDTLLRRALGLPKGDEAEPYLIDRTAASLLVTGDLDEQLFTKNELAEYATLYDTRKRTDEQDARLTDLRNLRNARLESSLKTREGAAFTKSRLVASQERGLRDITGWAGFRLNPKMNGDLVNRGLTELRAEYARQGRVDEFYDRYPEYQVREIATSNYDADPDAREVELDTSLYYFDRAEINKRYEQTFTDLNNAEAYLEAQDPVEEVRSALKDVNAQKSYYYELRQGEIDALDEVYPKRKETVSLLTDPKVRALFELRDEFFKQQDEVESFQERDALSVAFKQHLPPRDGHHQATDWVDLTTALLRTNLEYEKRIGKAFDEGKEQMAEKLQVERDAELTAIHELAKARVTRADFELFLEGGANPQSKEQIAFKTAEKMHNALMLLIGDSSPMSGDQKAAAVDAYLADPTYAKYYGNTFIDPTDEASTYAIARRRDIWDKYYLLPSDGPRIDYLRAVLDEYNALQSVLGLTALRLYDPTPPRPSLPWLAPTEEDADAMSRSIAYRGY